MEGKFILSYAFLKDLTPSFIVFCLKSQIQVLLKELRNQVSLM